MQEEIPGLSVRYARTVTHLEASSFYLISAFLSDVLIHMHYTGSEEMVLQSVLENCCTTGKQILAVIAVA